MRSKVRATKLCSGCILSLKIEETITCKLFSFGTMLIYRGIVIVVFCIVIPAVCV